MRKSCNCGHHMKLELRTIVFARKVNIVSVPVFACPACGQNEVFPGVKQDVGRLVGQLGARPDPGTIWFDEIHEWAGVLSHSLEQSESLHESAVARAAEERTNELLDLWLIASSLGDDEWKDELRRRLSQLNAKYIS